MERQEGIQEERRFRQQYVTAKKKKGKKEGDQSEQRLTGKEKKEKSALDSGSFDSEVAGFNPEPGQETVEENRPEQENAVHRRLINIHV